MCLPNRRRDYCVQGRGCMCRCVGACGVVGGVGLVTHYKCQEDLSPQPVHLLLGAAGATDGRGELVSAHQKTCSACQIFLTQVGSTPSFGLFTSVNLVSFSAFCGVAVDYGERLQLLVNRYGTLRPIGAVCEGMGAEAKKASLTGIQFAPGPHLVPACEMQLVYFVTQLTVVIFYKPNIYRLEAILDQATGQILCTWSFMVCFEKKFRLCMGEETPLDILAVVRFCSLAF